MEISFIYPIFLIGLSLIIIPIIIHLLQKQKVIQLQFSTTLFFKSSTLKKSKFRKINQILQLLIRILIIAFLVILFSTPFKNSDPFNKLISPNVKIYCWLDQSLSMDLIHNNSSLLQQSIESINSIDSILSGELLLYTEGEFKTLANINSKSHSPSFENFLIDLKKQTSKDKKIILLFSDFLKSNISLLNFIKNDTDHLIIAVNMQPRNISNLALKSITIEERNDKEITVLIKKEGKDITNSIELISGKMRRGAQNIVLNNQIDKKISMKLSDDIEWGNIKLSKNDDFIHDNNIFFSIKDKKSEQILFITEQETFSTLKEALKTVVDSTNYKIKTTTLSSLKAEDIEQSTLIILNSIIHANSDIYSILQPGLFKNKSFIFSPSLTTEAKIFNNEVMKFLNSKSNIEVLDTSTISPSFKFSNKTLWSKFQQEDIDNIQISSFISEIPGDALLKSNFNKKLISKVKDSNGSSWIISSFELEASAKNNLSTSGFYIPLVDKIIKEMNIAGNTSSSGYTASKTFTSPISDPKNQYKIISLTNPNFNQIFNTPFISINAPGVYEISNSMGESKTFPINYDQNELELSYENIKSYEERSNLKILKPNSISKHINSLSNGNLENILLFSILILLILDLLITLILKGRRSANNSTI